MSKKITLAELQGHNVRGNAWMVIGGKVYDVTHFLQDHPGGEEVLVELAGQDATEAFEEIGHTQDARDLLVKMLVGDFDAGEPNAQPATAAKAANVKSGAPVKKE